MQPLTEDATIENGESDPRDELYVVVTITADCANETSKNNSRTLVIYNIRQHKVNHFSMKCPDY